MPPLINGHCNVVICLGCAQVYFGHKINQKHLLLIKYCAQEPEREKWAPTMAQYLKRDGCNLCNHHK